MVLFRPDRARLRHGLCGVQMVRLRAMALLSQPERKNPHPSILQEFYDANC